MNHMEHDLCLRFAAIAGLENLGLLLNGDFYHQWHKRAVGVKVNPIRPIHDLRVQASHKAYANEENWGLRDFQQEISETIL